jgi:hypothetical protein
MAAAVFQLATCQSCASAILRRNLAPRSHAEQLINARTNTMQHATHDGTVQHALAISHKRVIGTCSSLHDSCCNGATVLCGLNGIGTDVNAADGFQLMHTAATVGCEKGRMDQRYAIRE